MELKNNPVNGGISNSDLTKKQARDSIILLFIEYLIVHTFLHLDSYWSLGNTGEPNNT